MDDVDRAVLDFAGRRYRLAGAMEQAVRDDLGLTLTRYHQVLNRVIDDPEALLERPVLVRRLQRIRAARVRQRGVGRTA